MIRTPKRLLALAILVLGGLVLQAGAVLACNQLCMRVDDPNRPFCRQCVDTDNYTGATCENLGTCGCAYTHNTCGLSASGIKADVQQAGLSFLEQEGSGRVCPAAVSGDIAR